MEYNKIVAVSGMPGLYELVNSKADGAIVRSLDDNSTRFASSRIHNFSHLESIEIYTTGENVNLVEIFYAMEKAGGSLPDGKDAAAVKTYFEKTYPELDFERVYASDLKKMVKWYEVLKSKNIEIKLSEPPVEEEVEEPKEEKKPAEEKKAAKKPVAEEEKPKAKTAAKKEEPPKQTKKDSAKKEEEKKEKPAAKKATPKKEADKEEAPKKKTAAKKK
jgi:hypothetical protein